MQDFIDTYLADSVAALAAFQSDAAGRAAMVSMAEAITASLHQGGKLMIAGNGGSAADAQHIAGEFTSRLFFDRAPLPAMALTGDSSALTAIGNDYGYEHVFARQVLGLGQAGDVLLGISTSGGSPNVLRAFAAARDKGVTCIGFTGSRGGPMAEACSLLLQAPSSSTPIIQQIHITAAHIVCGLVERAMFA